MIFETGILYLFLTTTLSAAADEKQLLSQFSHSNGKFAVNLYKTIADSNAGENVIVSPFSVQTGGALLYSGSAGSTAEELVKGLSLFENDVTNVGNGFELALKNLDRNSVQVANKIYLEKDAGLKPEFINVIRGHYLSEEQNVDFVNGEKTAETINSWVQTATRNKIKNLFKPSDFDQLTFMALVNTIYFKGSWEIPFEVTQKGKFFVAENQTKEVDMMYVSCEFFNYGEFNDLNVKVVQLNYKSPELSMLIIVPNEPFGLKELEEKLLKIDLIELQKKLQENYVTLYLPKFEIESTIDLEEGFTKLGMGSLFGEPNFANMLKDPSRKAKVSKAIHKAFIGVTEQGTEAGAASGFAIHDLTVPLLLKADHPFFFAIVSKSAVLFTGRYVK